MRDCSATASRPLACSPAAAARQAERAAALLAASMAAAGPGVRRASAATLRAAVLAPPRASASVAEIAGLLGATAPPLPNEFFARVLRERHPALLHAGLRAFAAYARQPDKNPGEGGLKGLTLLEGGGAACEQLPGGLAASCLVYLSGQPADLPRAETASATAAEGAALWALHGPATERLASSAAAGAAAGEPPPPRDLPAPRPAGKENASPGEGALPPAVRASLATLHAAAPTVCAAALREALQKLLQRLS